MTRENLARFMLDNHNARFFVRESGTGSRSAGLPAGRCLSLRNGRKVYYVCPDCESAFGWFKALSQYVDSAAESCEIKQDRNMMRRLGRVMRGLKEWRRPEYETESDSDWNSDESC